MPTDSSAKGWDVVVIGGALSGASTALLLLRRNPRLRLLILERSSQFKRRVGESTVEISAYFLGRVLGLTDHLNDRHLVKQGLRFWFCNAASDSLEACSETGPGYNVRFPGYQVDRAVLDEEVLARAQKAGAHLLRPVRVRNVDLTASGPHTVEWTTADGGVERTTARWIVDASGVAALLARKQGWLETNHAHPIASAWSRWSSVKNWDSAELAAKFPAYGRRTKAVRYTATNHFVGRGWWAWCIPLKGGDTSVGIVFDQRLIDLPEGECLGERLRAMLLTHPAAREILAEATWHEGDVLFRRNLAYRSRVFAGPGFVLVGDAAAFMDPFYSPGMDWISATASAAAALVDAACRGRPMADRIARHNELFNLSYDRWFDAIYRDKYHYMGDQELMTLAFRLDLGLYYFGVVSQPFLRGARSLEVPPFASRESRLPAKLIACYNRRFAAIARDRHARGVWGRRNSHHHFRFTSYQLDVWLPIRIIVALGAWLRLELREGWRTWWRPSVAAQELPPHATRAAPAPRLRNKASVETQGEVVR
jgi:flavin-dependent dehydrogenase